MKLYKILFLLLLISINTKAQSSIYSFQIDSVANGSVIDFNAFSGKKILIVNAASGDSAFNQYEELKQLQQLYAESLIIVIVPSNSFGNEQLSEAEMATSYQQNSGIYFPVSIKLAVTGSNIHPLYSWLTQKSLNAVMDIEVKADFQKFLIDREGKLVGVFSKRVKPLSNDMQEAIQTNN